MNAKNYVLEGYSRWLALLTSMMLGLLFASKTCGQELDSHESVLAEKLITLESHDARALPAPVITESPLLHVTNPVADQQIRTKGTCSDPSTCVCVSGRDEVWLVSARQSHLCPNDISRLETFRLLDGVWKPFELVELTRRHSTDKSKATLIYVHGNRTSLDWAKSRGLQVYQSLLHTKPASCGRVPVRMVIFAWKSDQEMFRLLRDYNLKSSRATIIGQSFANLLGQFQDRNMVLCGFSLGGQVVLGGVSDPSLIGQSTHGRYQVALLGPALDASFVCNELQSLPNNPFVSQTELFFSRNDRAINVAERIARKKCQEWLPVFRQLESESDFSPNPIKANDITTDISRRHSATNYAGALAVQSMILKMLGQANTTPLASPFIDDAMEFETPSILEAVEPADAPTIELLAPQEFSQ